MDHEEDSAGVLSDEAIVARVRAGDTQSFELLVRRNLTAAHSLARATLGRHGDDADDIVQEAFIAALQRIDDCRDPARFRAWLLTIVRNKSHNHRNYLMLRSSSGMDEAQSIPAADDSSLAVEEGELHRRLEIALTHLTDLQRVVFRLHVMEGWAHAEIAAELGISSGGSRFHLHVARRAIRKHLTGFAAGTLWNRG